MAWKEWATILGVVVLIGFLIGLCAALFITIVDPEEVIRALGRAWRDE